LRNENEEPGPQVSFHGVRGCEKPGIAERFEDPAESQPRRARDGLRSNSVLQVWPLKMMSFTLVDACSSDMRSTRTIPTKGIFRDNLQALTKTSFPFETPVIAVVSSAPPN
jgi:hypothetical protein